MGAKDFFSYYVVVKYKRRDDNPHIYCIRRKEAIINGNNRTQL